MGVGFGLAVLVAFMEVPDVVTVFGAVYGVFRVVHSIVVMSDDVGIVCKYKRQEH